MTIDESEREFKMVTKLSIALRALKEIEFNSPSCFTSEDCPLFNKYCWCDSENNCGACIAHTALAKIKEIK